MSLKTPLARVHGLGSARSGVSHYWIQRLTAVALVPLTLWFITGLHNHAGDSYFLVRAWLAQPLTAILMLLFIVSGVIHMRLGMQVVFEDYIQKETLKLIHFIGNVCFAAGLGVAAVYAVLKISLGS